MNEELIKRLFNTTVEEIEDGYKVIFEGKGGNEGYILYKRAKRGWSNKPVSQNTYLIGDANIYQVLDKLKKYLTLEENEITKVKQIFSNISLQILEEYLSTETHYENNHQNNTDDNSDEFTHEPNGGEDTIKDRTTEAEQQEK